MSAQTGKHGYSGSCAPGSCWVGESFSYGIFEMAPAKTATGWKKGPVKVRVGGPSGKAKEIKAKTEEIVVALDAGTYAGPKNVKVK